MKTKIITCNLFVPGVTAQSKMIGRKILTSKLFHLIVLSWIITLGISVHAQNWTLTGNSGTNSSTDFVGTTDSKALVFRTTNIERMRISESGLVGIGISNPALAKLVTNGSVGNTMAIFGNLQHGISLVNDLPSIGFNAYYNTGWKALNSGFGGTIYLNHTTGDMQFTTSTNGFSRSSPIITTERMTLKQNGNLGVGAINPSHARLEINGNVGAAVAMFGADKCGVAIEADNPEVGFNYFYNGGTKTIKAGYAAFMGMYPSNGDIYIGNFNGSQSGSNFGNITGEQTVMTISQKTSIGIVGIGTTTPAAALDAQARNGGIKTGVSGYSTYGWGTGVRGECDNGIMAIGVLGTSTEGIGVYGHSNTSYAGFFSGNLTYTGTLSGPSDQKLKENIKPLDNTLDKIMQLKPSLYNFRKEYSQMNLPQGQQTGFIAQDMEKVFPQLVSVAHDKEINAERTEKIVDYKTINYIGLIPLLTRAIQEQQKQIEALTETVNKLPQGAVISSKGNDESVKSALVTNAQLEQNVPNPFNKTTIINYTLPAKFTTAQIIITDKTGKTLKVTEVSGSGKGMLQVDASTLATGAYNYSLYIEGKLIASKQMITAK